MKLTVLILIIGLAGCATEKPDSYPKLDPRPYQSSYIRQSTETITYIGPVISDEDGLTPMSQRFTRSDDVWIAMADDFDPIDISDRNIVPANNGWLEVPLTKDDTSKQGELVVVINGPDGGYLPIYSRFYVIAPDVYDRCEDKGRYVVEHAVDYPRLENWFTLDLVGIGIEAECLIDKFGAQEQP